MKLITSKTKKIRNSKQGFYPQYSKTKNHGVYNCTVKSCETKNSKVKNNALGVILNLANGLKAIFLLSILTSNSLYCKENTSQEKAAPENTASIKTAKKIPKSSRSINAENSVKDSLIKQLSSYDLEYGAPIFIRIFKESSQLELWLKNDLGHFVLFKSYAICSFSGELGPKLKQGDWQSPEGFYFVKPIQLNPWSQYHLSFNLGFPNRFDRAHNRTGSALMVHGDCVSIGCYAMTDPQINEIYSLASAALEKGQPFFRVHAFPFKMTDERLAKEAENTWFSFWQNLKTGYDIFEQSGIPPNVTVDNKQYVFDIPPINVNP